jgi:hypothetical protein
VCLYALVYGQPQRKELEAHINLRYIHEIKLTSAKNFVLWCLHAGLPQGNNEYSVDSERSYCT